eukprot:CAMPEP_0201548698 /NCGR_PEP_ID=MMETSP0173_2-20130828/5226_1 /ASSEMBLY_ACC=CAM_ASM_000268 /TAXON_ID=218659 /ORGANISM="Vexillifera sp., Strain DIVA3 564/2" /LENGTH=276 /DNA_ID=CAMNT_0047958149 /DNA_START=65 /DNA_END=895 /DNA_ORIENTATION=+
MDWLFGKKKTTKEIIREQQKSLRRNIREIEREQKVLERSEKQTIIQIKKHARAGETSSARILARNLVRTRAQANKLLEMTAHLKNVSTQIQMLKSQQAVAEAMKGCTKAMVRMNRQINVPAMQSMMMEFERQSEMLGMKDEIISDAMDDMMDDIDEEAESEQILNQVLDEIGISISDQMASAPNNQLGLQTASSTTTPATNTTAPKQAELLSDAGSPPPSNNSNNNNSNNNNSNNGGGHLANNMPSTSAAPPPMGSGGTGASTDNDLEARLAALKT